VESVEEKGGKEIRERGFESVRVGRYEDSGEEIELGDGVEK